MLDEVSLLGKALHSKNMHDTTDEADETLSLSDLPLYGDQSVEEWEDDFSAESQGSSSISSSEHDYFEFFSQELSPSTTSFPPENFIFCGKLIPYRKPDTSENDVSFKVVESEKQTSAKKKRGWSLFGWKFSFSRSSKGQVQSKNGKKSTTTLMHKKDHHHRQSSKKKYKKKKQGKGYGFRLHKMSIFTSTSSGKARWYLFLFGISRFSSEMELRDIKSRQSRRQGPPPSPTLRFLNHHDEKVNGGTNRGSGLWGLIKVLSCGKNHHPNTMVVGSIGCNRPE